ncbi:MAG: ABC transporter ATP-binding protein [Clostridia bacterium]|nr:ABC transporter ATP-binding protein [Clostridia bacterium]
MKVIKTINLTKKFGDFIANDNINLEIEKGSITAIMGENGAGKTTLMNMFYGLSKPTSGELLINGKKANFKSPQDAIKCGLGMVHQHFKLVPGLTVFENILLGTEITAGPFIDTMKEIKEVSKLITEYKFELNPKDKVSDISIGAKQRVEILKMLYRKVDILIFDEPTAVLTPQEVDELLQSFRELKKQGKTIILITHKLREIMEVSDEVIVIKKGKIVGNVKTSKTNPKELANMMVGRDVVLDVSKREKDFSTSKVLYKVENLKTENDLGKTVVDNISFEIREGEILGVCGVEGNGQSELVKLLTGLMEKTEGKVFLNGEDITGMWPDELRKKGLAFIPEDRYAQGLCRDMSLSDNIIAGYHSGEKYCSFGLLKRKEITKTRDELIDFYDIRISEREGNISSLSGGNAQKVIIAREFDADPKVIIASQPTRGVDIGSIEFIYKKILELREKGKGILLVSSELSEIMSLSDRIIVMYKGKIVGQVDGKTATKEKLGLLMAGVR